MHYNGISLLILWIISYRYFLKSQDKVNNNNKKHVIKVFFSKITFFFKKKKKKLFQFSFFNSCTSFNLSSSSLFPTTSCTRASSSSPNCRLFYIQRRHWILFSNFMNIRFWSFSLFLFWCFLLEQKCSCAYYKIKKMKIIK